MLIFLFILLGTDCPVVTINGTQLPVKNEVKYLGLILDQKLTWRPHITAKKTEINTLRTGSFKLFKRPLPGFLTIFTL